MIFSAIAMIAFTGGSFASNELVNESLEKKEEFNTNCSVTVTYSVGNRIHVVTYEFDASSRTSCTNQINNQLEDLKKEGKNVTESSTCYDAKVLTPGR